MSDDITKKVISIIAAEFKVSPGEIVAETVAADVDGWDSIRHINLLLKIEDAFELEFDTGEVSAVSNVGELIALVRKAAAS